MADTRLRADLHLHSDHSGLKQLRFLRMRDCYSAPLDVYRRAKARGMDLVTLTDHDTIDGCLEIRDRLNDPADFFISEEVETFLPGLPANRSMHIGVFGITEAQHREIQRLRGDFTPLVEYLAQEQIPSALNHLFRGFRPGLDAEQYLGPLVGAFDLFETRNGTQSLRYRRLTERAIEHFRGHSGGQRPGQSGGSDAHTLCRVARTWTECPAGDRESFLAGLKAGRGVAAGVDGTLFPLARDVYSVIFSYYGSLMGRERVTLARGEKWPGVLFVLATLPSHLIALPLLATCWNLLLKRIGLSRIEAAIDRLSEGPAEPQMASDAELCPDPDL